MTGWGASTTGAWGGRGTKQSGTAVTSPTGVAARRPIQEGRRESQRRGGAPSPRWRGEREGLQSGASPQLQELRQWCDAHSVRGEGKRPGVASPRRR